MVVVAHGSLWETSEIMPPVAIGHDRAHVWNEEWMLNAVLCNPSNSAH
jgi:hypothetical protein